MLSLVKGSDLIVIAGGDGTVSAVVRILASLAAPPPFAVVPLGTGNDLARSLGWWATWRHGGLDAFWAGVVAGRVESMDLWSLGADRVFLAYAGFGMDARIAASFSRWRPKYGTFAFGAQWSRLLYAAMGLRHMAAAGLGGRFMDLRITVADRTGVRESIAVTGPGTLLLANIDSYAGGGRLALNSKWNDGVLDLYFMPTVRSYLEFILRGRIGFLEAPHAGFQAASLKITGGRRPIPIQLDGEWGGDLESLGPFQVELMRVVPVLVPPPDLAARQRVGRIKEPADRLKQRAGSVVPGPAACGVGHHFLGPQGDGRPKSF